jgi:hypothetical protein
MSAQWWEIVPMTSTFSRNPMFVLAAVAVLPLFASSPVWAQKPEPKWFNSNKGYGFIAPSDGGTPQAPLKDKSKFKKSTGDESQQQKPHDKWCNVAVCNIGGHKAGGGGTGVSRRPVGRRQHKPLSGVLGNDLLSNDSVFSRQGPAATGPTPSGPRGSAIAR